MKRYLIIFHVLFICFLSFGQGNAKNKKYPSIFWEISGNGLKKPSYLFGTMHVSSKIAFQLSDSFYTAIKKSDVVALETNPESWQEDMDKYDADTENDSNPYSGWSPGSTLPDDYLSINSLKIGKYEKRLELALFSRPAVINNLLYRSYSSNASDFEEDTYLDMYIYQTGKKMGKQVAGVENYAESMRLMKEAYRDAAKEKNKKEKSFDIDEEFSPSKIQEAYRTGNLDQLDSINKLNSQSDAFDEKFLYRRNEIQANSIDSILKKSSLFVGVGAAHLPGSRGVIELLRRKGYKLRPIFMGSRDSRHKEEVDKIRVPVNFTTQVSEDGFFKADIPGKFFQFSKNNLLNQVQYADMANGSFYMTTRVKTNGLFWGHHTEMVAKEIDSLLYENVPGKILSKTLIQKNGYKGFDITSRTRRGDLNRYNIFITQYEVLFFIMGGNGDYVKNGTEAGKFFGSIQLKEFKNGNWRKFEPSYGGFAVDLPQEPKESIIGQVQYDTEEKLTGTQFSILRTDIHNYSFAGVDTFDLLLMNESFASSEFIDKTISQKYFVYKGYPALECIYRHKDSSVFTVRFIIQGPHYYTLVTHAAKENPSMSRFLNSFSIKPFVYKEPKQRTDTSLFYSVTTTWYPAEKSEKMELPAENNNYSDEEDEATDFGIFKTRIIANDTTGERVWVSFYKPSKYFYTKDSSLYRDNDKLYSGVDSAWIIRAKKKSIMPGNFKVLELVASDSNSSRAIWSKTFYKDGIAFELMTQIDTLSEPGSFVKNFFDNFSPADTIKGMNVYKKKAKIYFADLFSKDTLIRKKAIRSVSQVQFDSTDLQQLENAINTFKWTDKKYLDTKISFINKLGGISTIASADLLNKIYNNSGDTVQIQNAVLETLLKQKTQYSYNLFRDIITNEPPVVENSKAGYTTYTPLSPSGKSYNYFSNISNGNFFDELEDTLKLTHTILPDLLPLLNLEDYKWPIMRILRTMLDSNLIKSKDYETYFSKFLIEAKQEIKKQTIGEKKAAIAKAEEDKTEKKQFNYNIKGEDDSGNENLGVFATLLLPFYNSVASVPPFFKQLLSSNDRRLKYNTIYLFLRNKQSVPDTLLKYFASKDEYRYELFSDLKALNQSGLFPAEFNNKRDLAKSKLISDSDIEKPDSLQFVDSLTTRYEFRNGVVYFFRYKMKKDDAAWKIAVAGLFPPGPGSITFDDMDEDLNSFQSDWQSESFQDGKHGFTDFTDIKIKEDEPIKDQLTKQLKKILYSKTKSGKQFYEEKGYQDDLMSIRFSE